MIAPVPVHCFSITSVGLNLSIIIIDYESVLQMHVSLSLPLVTSYLQLFLKSQFSVQGVVIKLKAREMNSTRIIVFAILLIPKIQCGRIAYYFLQDNKEFARSYFVYCALDTCFRFIYLHFSFLL